MTKSSTVHSPRNVELPAHVIARKSSKSHRGRKRCLCLSCWLVGLILLGSAVVVLAHFLLPSTQDGSSTVNRLIDDKLWILNDWTDEFCIDIHKNVFTLEQKIHLTELILVGMIHPERSDEIEVVTTLKQDASALWREDNKVLRFASGSGGVGEPCHHLSATRQIFFLSPVSDNSQFNGTFEVRSRFHSMITTPKLVQIVLDIIDSNRTVKQLHHQSVVHNNRTVIEDNEWSPCQDDSIRCYFGGVCQALGESIFCSCSQVCDEGPRGSSAQVCGSDHVTYKNECALKKAACGKQSNITILASKPCSDINLCGECAENEVCLKDPQSGLYRCSCEECPLVHHGTVCGDDGVEYLSHCHLRYSSCQRNSQVTLLHEGPCDLCRNVVCPDGMKCRNGQCLCPENCPDDYDPICGSDGKSHHNECWMSCANRSEENVFGVHKGLCLRHQPPCGSNIDGSCDCPDGHSGPFCDACQPGFWAFTSFGCTPCSCYSPGSIQAECNAFTGECLCKEGFSGQKCNICPNGSMANETNCFPVSTRYSAPIPCGTLTCDFGSTCSYHSQKPTCVCEIDCSNQNFVSTPVCGNDGNTYRSECQLRQYSCRIQKEVALVDVGPCKDAPSSIYGPDKQIRQADILSDDLPVTVATFGLLGDECQKSGDCVSEFSECHEVYKTCVCRIGYKPSTENFTCQAATDLSLCDSNPCQNGGSCEEHDGVYSCYCPEGLAGPQCQHDTSKANISVASFVGDSLVGVLTPEETISRVEIDLIFKSFSENGILLYTDAGELENDFFSLAIIEGYVELKYDLGSGVPLTLKSAQPIQLGQWHHVEAKRYHQDGLLTLDDGEKVTGQSRGSLKTLNVGQLSWLGGVDSSLAYIAKQRVGTHQGFNGCIREFKFGRNVVRTQSELEPLIMRRKNVKECSHHPCSSMPCYNQGSCSAQSQGYVCECKPSFTGRQCHLQRNQCHPNPCKHHGKCILQSADGQETFRCECKLGFDGRLCEDILNKTIDGPRSRRYRKSLSHDGKQKLSFRFRTNTTDSLLLKANAGLRRTLDNNTVQQEMAHIHFNVTSSGKLRISLQSEALIPYTELANSKSRINDGRWHSFNFILHHKTALTKVDQDVISTTKLSLPEKSWILVSPDSMVFADEVKGVLCLNRIQMTWWHNGRQKRTKPMDICR